MLKNLSPELKELARMPPFSFKSLRLVLEILVAPVEIDRLAIAKEYLAGQGWKQSGSIDDEVRYKRGSWIGNLFSFDAQNLKATALLKASNSAIVLSMEVDTTGQIITIWNYISLQAELADFGESVVTGEVCHRLRRQFSKECGARMYYDWTRASNYWSLRRQKTFEPGSYWQGWAKFIKIMVALFLARAWGRGFSLPRQLGS